MTDTSQSGSSADPRNPDLVLVHRALVAIVAKLDLAMDDAADAAQVKALAAQIAETNVRVTAVGRELFARSTLEVTDASKAIASVIPEVERALADLAKLDAFVGQLSDMLALVDHAVATAKMAG